jgi:protein SCO1/2
MTVDPERDAPEVLRAFLREPYPRFSGVTGSREPIDNGKRAFRVCAPRRDEGAGDYVIPHTAMTYVLDPGGRFIDYGPAV